MNFMNYENFTSKKIIISFTFPAFFIFSFVIFSSIVSACDCCNPGLMTESGAPISSFGGGYFIVNGSKYSNDVQQVTYNLKVHNANNGVLTVTLEPEFAIQDYVSSPAVKIPPKTIGTLPLKVWIDGNDISGKLSVIYQCGSLSYGLSLSVYIGIVGQGNSTPPISTCTAAKRYNGCYNGTYRMYTCDEGNLAYTSTCTNYCCKREGGYGSFCVDDSTCLAMNKLPTPTEGNIALLCKNDECDSGIEKNIWVLFRWKGWDVLGKSYKSWTADELNQYDIIACSESSVCKFDFNSILYNMHFENRKPFLEIPSSSGAKAAYSFDYVSTASGKVVKDPQLLYSQDYITNGISSPGIFAYGSSFAGVENGKINDGTKSIASSSDNLNSLIFKVKETITHGRYAYIGLFPKTSLTGLTLEGGKIFNNTLKWLKYGDAWFGGTTNNDPPKGKIAFICSSEKCNSKSDVDIIKFLRSIGYSVVSKSQKNWLTTSLNSYNVILCASSRACKIPVGSNIYNAHKFGGKDFVEIVDATKLYAAYSFGYIADASAKRKSSTNVSFVNNDAIISDFNQPLPVILRSKSMASLQNPLSSPMTDVAHINYKGIDQHLSTMFYVPESGSGQPAHGRYMFIGWTGRFDIKNINDNGKLLLQWAINWANCGKMSCP